MTRFSKSRTWITEAVAIVLFFVVLIFIAHAHLAPDNSVAVRATVMHFGDALQQVSLQAPDAATEIQNAYAAYVDPTLLQQWEANPSLAPGRLTSSPWPDHLTISSISQDATTTYSVVGSVIEETSTGESGSYDVTMTVEKENGGWFITSFMGSPAS